MQEDARCTKIVVQEHAWCKKIVMHEDRGARRCAAMQQNAGQDIRVTCTVDASTRRATIRFRTHDQNMTTTQQRSTTFKPTQRLVVGGHVKVDARIGGHGSGGKEAALSGKGRGRSRGGGGASDGTGWDA